VRAEAAQRKFDPAVAPEHSLLGMRGVIEEGRLIGAPAMLPVLFTLLPRLPPAAKLRALADMGCLIRTSAQNKRMFLATPGWHICFLSILARAMSAGLGEQRGGEGVGSAKAKAKAAGSAARNANAAGSAEADASANASANASAEKEEESDAGAVVQLALHVLVTLLHASMEEEGGWREVEGIAAVEGACVSRVVASARKGLMNAVLVHFLESLAADVRRRASASPSVSNRTRFTAQFLPNVVALVGIVEAEMLATQAPLDELQTTTTLLRDAGVLTPGRAAAAAKAAAAGEAPPAHSSVANLVWMQAPDTLLVTLIETIDAVMTLVHVEFGESAPRSVREEEARSTGGGASKLESWGELLTMVVPLFVDTGADGSALALPPCPTVAGSLVRLCSRKLLGDVRRAQRSATPPAEETIHLLRRILWQVPDGAPTLLVLVRGALQVRAHSFFSLSCLLSHTCLLSSLRCRRSTR
jgi:hypothetical protein